MSGASVLTELFSRFWMWLLFEWFSLDWIGLDWIGFPADFQCQNGDTMAKRPQSELNKDKCQYE